MDDRLALVADVLIGAETAVAFTGAGVSTASGVPDFRHGDWGEDFDIGDYHVSNLNVDPRGFWRMHVDHHDKLYADSVVPNEAHRVLAELEADGWLEAVITQNTDGLHQQAGSERVVELHGNGRRATCRRCDRDLAAATAVERAREGHYPPTCEHCGGILRPDVSLFGERLPSDAMSEAQQLADESDVLLALGTSLSVEPGASVAKSVARDGTLVIATDEGTAFDDMAAAAFHADVTDFLSQLAGLVAVRH